MHKKFFTTTAILLAVAAGLVVSAVAQVHGRYGHHHGAMLRRMTRELDLTDAQQTQIKGILQSQKTKIQPLMQQLRQNRQAESANVTGTFDETQVRTFAQKQAQIMADLTVERERTKSQIYAVLTPEQRQKALTLQQERHQRRGQRHNDVPKQGQQP